jgi:hypothetical protein
MDLPVNLDITHLMESVYNVQIVKLLAVLVHLLTYVKMDSTLKINTITITLVKHV